MRFPPSFLDEIRARVPLSAVIGRRVAWDRRKSRPNRGDYWACCPFHGEKTPSFHAEDSKGRYHCFGCGVSGDHFTFLTELEGLSFPDAVERLAAEAGLPMPAADPRAEERERRRASLVEVLEMAARFFEASLAGQEGGPARSYLRNRRIGVEAQRRFRIGYAAPGKTALRDHLASKGVGADAMAEAGLLVTGEDIPVGFDRFRDRVIFPIADLRGRVVGFGGRALSADAQAKYLNSPETPLFHKGSLLYRHAEARTAARTKGTVIAVEGYVDVIAMATAGFEHTVAPLGTALTETQLEMLWRMAPEPILCFDGDSAGLRAAARVIDMALPQLQPGRSLRFALLPEGQDPDDLIGSGGAEAMRTVLTEARPLVDMLWGRESEAGPFDTPERRAALEQRLANATRSIGEASVRRHYEQAMAERLAAFFGPAPAGRTPAPRRRDQAWRQRGPGDRGRLDPRAPILVSESLRRSALARVRSRPAPREAILVLTLVSHPALLHDHLDLFAELDLPPELDSLRAVLLELAGSEPALDAADVGTVLERGGLGPLHRRLAELAQRCNAWQALPAADIRDAEQGWLQAVTLHRKSGTLHKELREAERALAADPSEANLARIRDIQHQLSSAEGTEAAVEGFGALSGRKAGGL